jgi:hypothetical protein
MLTKGDVKIGVATRFGPNWPGKRCGAKTKSGTPCQRPAVSRTGRCYRHGGKSTGPRTEEGRSRIAALHTKHGRYTKEKREAARASAEVGRSIRAELRQIEKTLIRSGLLEPGWRDAFEPGASCEHLGLARPLESNLEDPLGIIPEKEMGRRTRRRF